MNLITLNTDWHKDDYYYSALQAKLMKVKPKINIVNISNQISSFNSYQSAFILKKIFHLYPINTIHINLVNFDLEKLKVVYYKKHYFIGNDDGFFSYIVEKDDFEAYSINFDKIKIKNITFAELEIIPLLINEIRKNVKETDVLIANNKIEEKINLRPAVETNSITGHIIYFDSYGNAITNISKEFFAKQLNNKNFQIILPNKYDKITEISRMYSEDDYIFALFNSLSLLELGLYKQNLKKIYELENFSNIFIKIIDS